MRKTSNPAMRPVQAINILRKKRLDRISGIIRERKIARITRMNTQKTNVIRMGIRYHIEKNIMRDPIHQM